MSNARGNTTAVDVDGSYLLVVGDTFTKTVFARTNACVSVNSDDVRTRGSNGCSPGKFARTAELDSEGNDPKETWRPLVKLHNLPWNAINRLGEDQGRRLKQCASDGSGSGKSGTFRPSQLDRCCFVWQIQRFGEPPYAGSD